MEQAAYIGLGSNLGAGHDTLRQAWQAIGECEGVSLQAISSPYLSAPVDMESSNWFTNAVGKLSTARSAVELLDLLLAVEADFGRRREGDASGYQDRTLDLDILYFGEMVLATERLVIPHPQLARRLFVLKPLAEIAPDLRDPSDNLTVREKLGELKALIAAGLIPRQEISRSEWPGAEAA